MFHFIDLQKKRKIDRDLDRISFINVYSHIFVVIMHVFFSVL